MTTLSSTRASICDSFLDSWDKVLSPIQQVRDQYRSYVNNLTKGINEVADWLDPTAALTDLISQVNLSIPGTTLSDLQELWDIIQQCLYLNGTSPISTIYNAQNGIYRIIDATIDDLTIINQQFGPAKWASKINDLLYGIGIPGGQIISDLLKQADQLLDCIVYICGGYYDPRYLPIDYMNYANTFGVELDDLYLDLNVEDNPLSPLYGTFKIDTIYDQLGVAPANRAMLNTTIKGIDDVKQMAISGTNNAVSAIKQATRLGEIFV